MSVLVVGGDKLGNIEDKLVQSGFSNIFNITGRKRGDRKIKIPSEIDLVLVLVDYIEHPLMNIIKKETRRQGIELIFSKRAWSHIENKINGRMRL